MNAGRCDSDVPPGLGIVAIAVVLLAYVIATRDPAAQERVEEALRAEINARYDAHCARFARSDDAEERIRCIAALWLLRAWEDERRAADRPDGMP
jgi:hypothetical protein